MSRAVRTPSELQGQDRQLRLGRARTRSWRPALCAHRRRQPDLEPEVLWAYELGYRIQPNHRVSVDVAAFYNNYSRLVGRQPAASSRCARAR